MYYITEIVYSRAHNIMIIILLLETTSTKLAVATIKQTNADSGIVPYKLRLRHLSIRLPLHWMVVVVVVGKSVFHH